MPAAGVNSGALTFGGVDETKTRALTLHSFLSGVTIGMARAVRFGRQELCPQEQGPAAQNAFRWPYSRDKVAGTIQNARAGVAVAANPVS